MRTFVKRKGNSPLNHQFSVVTFYDNSCVDMICDFTRSQEVLFTSIDSLIARPENFNGIDLDLTMVFRNAHDIITTATGSISSEQDYVIRYLLIFGRSYNVW